MERQADATKGNDPACVGFLCCWECTAAVIGEKALQASQDPWKHQEIGPSLDDLLMIS